MTNRERNRNLREWFDVYPSGFDNYGDWADAISAFMFRVGTIYVKIGRVWVPEFHGAVGVLITAANEGLLPLTRNARRLEVGSNGKRVTLRHWAKGYGSKNIRVSAIRSAYCCKVRGNAPAARAAAKGS